MSKHYTIPIFIPELACPFQCVFCNQRKITGKNLIPDDANIIQTIDKHLSTFQETDRTVEVGFFGGSFTGIPLDQQAKYLELVQPYVREGQVAGIRLSTRPDYISFEILEHLKRYQVNAIELGAQSMDEEVLRKSRRGHTARQTREAAELILNSGFELGLQMMIGLPGDTLEKSVATAREIIRLGAATTRIYPALVIRDTQLHTWYDTGNYEPLSLEQAISWTAEILPLFEANGVKVLRTGLHPSEGLLHGDELVAGPFHPSFKELVLTHLWRETMTKALPKNENGNLVIRVAEKEVNYAIGYHSQNRKMLQDRFASVRFIKDPGLSGMEMKYEFT